MLKKTISYFDFDNQETSETFYFNLSQAELLELELSTEGGYGDYLQKLAEEASLRPADLIKELKFLIKKAYGERSEDGKRFVKSEKLSEDFGFTNAYAALFFELSTNVDSTVEFVNGIMPGEVAQKVAEEAAAVNTRPVPQDRLPKRPKPVETVELDTAAPVLEEKQYSLEELQAELNRRRASGEA